MGEDAGPKLKKLSEFYGLEYDTVVHDSWNLLIHELRAEIYPYCYIQDSTPAVFWMKVLSSHFTIHPKLERLIKRDHSNICGHYRGNFFEFLEPNRTKQKSFGPK